MIVKDGLILPSEKILISKNNISYLINSDPKSEPSLKCVEGTYEFLVKKGGKTKNEKGCTNSKRFGELIAVFKSI